MQPNSAMMYTSLQMSQTSNDLLVMVVVHRRMKMVMMQHQRMMVVVVRILGWRSVGTLVAQNVDLVRVGVGQSVAAVATAVVRRSDARAQRKVDRSF